MMVMMMMTTTAMVATSVLYQEFICSAFALFMCSLFALRLAPVGSRATVATGHCRATLVRRREKSTVMNCGCEFEVLLSSPQGRSAVMAVDVSFEVLLNCLLDGGMNLLSFLPS
jgi:hypothetical protein